MIAKITAWLAGYMWTLVGVAGVALLAALGVQTVRLDHEQAARTKDQLQFATEKLKATQAAAAQLEAFRTEEQRRTAAQQKVLDEAEQKATRARADAVIADASAGRLQQRYNALVAAAREAARNPQTVQPGPATENPAGMLADVFGRCVARVRLLAAVADQRGTAGQTCEREYDALNPEEATSSVP